MGVDTAIFGLLGQANSVFPMRYHVAMHPKDNLAHNLGALMEHHKMSQGDMHRKSGVAQSTIGRILRKTTAADIDTVQSIAGVFQLAAWQLLSPHFDPSNPPVLAQASAEERELYNRLRQMFQEPKINR